MRRVLIVENMNAHITIWNLHYCKKQIVKSLKKLIKKHKLLVTNNQDYANCLSSLRI